MTKFKSFETKNLLLVPTSEKDATFIFELFNSPKWLKYIGDRNVKSTESAKEYIKTKMLPQLERLGFSNYTIIRKKDSAKMGTCGLYDRQGMEGIDIGFAFLPDFEKKGYAYEAAKTLVEAAKNDFQLNEISAITTKDNVSSQKLLEKLGLKLFGTTILEGDDEELLLYNLKISK